MKNRMAALLAVCALLVGLLTAPASASGSSAESTARADKLVSLHLFRGMPGGYALDDAPTRIQGLIMLIRLLGVEDTALACTDPNPFTDTTGYADRYAAYAYASGLTRGTSSTAFSPNTALNAGDYVTFLLRALGYSDKEGDFAYRQSLAFAVAAGLLSADAGTKLAAISMNRGDMVDLSYAALTCKMKGGTQTLAEKLRNDGVFSEDEGVAAGVLGENAGWVYTYTAPAPTGPAITHEKKTAATSQGSVTADVLTVDPRLATVKTALVDNTLGHTAPFSQIVANSGAAAVINGNFFASYDAFKEPIGHVMVNGEFLHGDSGISSLGITAGGEVRIGRPALFTRIKAADASWSAYTVNTSAQGGSVLYTPAYGASFTAKQAGSIMTVTAGTITGFQSVAAGTAVTIPANGYAVYMDSSFTSTSYFRTPVVGTPAALEYYLMREDPEGFQLDGLVSVVSGAPRLVQDGAIVTELEAGFSEARFTTQSSSRTAIGVNRAGKLLLVSVPSATIQQMRELMLGLGCVDAFNLDGGASCGMYYNGTYYATPGRELTVTLQVFPK